MNAKTRDLFKVLHFMVYELPRSVELLLDQELEDYSRGGSRTSTILHLCLSNEISGMDSTEGGAANATSRAHLCKDKDSAF